MKKIPNYRQIIIFLLILISGSAPVSAQQSGSGNRLTELSLQGSSLFKRGTVLTSNFSGSFAGSTAAPVSLMAAANNPDIKIYSGMGDNVLNSFRGDNLYLHLAAVASTALLSAGSGDYYVHKYFNEHEQYGVYARPVIRAAMYFPFVIGGSLYAFGKMNRDNEAVGASFAVLQSTVLAFAYNSLLKAVTGRAHPDWRNSDDMEGMSKTFRFGFGRGGIFWGWPSGHTSSTMAVVAALTSFYPDKTWLKYAGYGYVAYMVFAVSSLNRGGMHWFSDAVAASLMSYAIGSTVGKYYRSRFGNKSSAGEVQGWSSQSLPAFSFTVPL